MKKKMYVDMELAIYFTSINNTSTSLQSHDGV